MKPICIDLYCGLGGWSEGFLAEGYECIGFDIERHDYGSGGYPGQLVLQDVLTLHGSQFRDATCIVASPPCQEFPYMAMPWSRAKKIAEEYRSGERDVKKLTALFDACFRIQREAIEASAKECDGCLRGRDAINGPCEYCRAVGWTHRYIPLIVENVKGANPWVGRAKWHYGSFYLWGDVPALMPITFQKVMKQGITHLYNGGTNFHGYKTIGLNWSDQTHRGQDFTRIAAQQAIKNSGGSWFNIGSPGQKETNRNPVNGIKSESARFIGTERPKRDKDNFGWSQGSELRQLSSRSSARKAASAQIAKIPLPLAQHIARTFKP